MKKIKERKFPVKIIEYFTLSALYLVFYLLSSNNMLTAAVMVFAAIATYFYFSIKDDKNYLSFKAVFTGVWIFTTGLAQFRFNSFQQEWEPLMWVILLIANLSFIVANDLSVDAFPFLEKHFNFKKFAKKLGLFSFEFQKDRLFWITVTMASISVVFFLINIFIKGYIPFFESSTNNSAYVEFYTRLLIFVVACMTSGCLAYYCLIKCELSKIKKTILIIVIIVVVFAIPILLVQRGTFLIIGLILTAVIYLNSKKRRFVLLLGCVAVMLLVYQFGAVSRGYSDDQLEAFFEPQEVEITNPDGENEGISYKLSPKLSFVYSYLTVSHDNLNLAVSKDIGYSLGVLQLEPFNVIIRSDFINQKIDDVEIYLVRPHLTTGNLVTYAYYDFGLIGVGVLMFIWSFAFGLIESANKKYKGLFSCLLYGVCLSPIALSFFATWMSFFTIWLLWGTIMLIYFAANFKWINQKNNN